MARQPERPLIQRLTAPPKRRSGRLKRLADAARRRPWLVGIVSLPALAAVMVVVICSMVLLARNMQTAAKGCGDPQSGAGASTASYSTDLSAHGDTPGPGEPPLNFIDAYFAASNQPDAKLGPEGPYVLMGIHRIESGFGRSTKVGVHSGVNEFGCCKGPFQFYDIPGDWSTWLAKSPVSGKTFARDADSDGKADVYNNFDSMFAAAALLYASGAPGDWKKALFSYNRAVWYGEDVLRHAHEYEATVKPPAGAKVPPPAHGDPDSKLPAKPDAPADASPDSPDATLVAQSSSCGAGSDSELVATTSGGPYSPPMAAGSYTITTQFWTWRGSYNHEGADLAAPEGTPIRAIGDGKVTIAGPYDPDGYGTYICIEHTQQLKSCYGHPSRVDVHVGEMVKRGQVIGAVGQEGNSTGPHLHFEVFLDGAAQCPANYVGTSPKEWCTTSAPGFNAKPETGAQPA